MNISQSILSRSTQALATTANDAAPSSSQGEISDVIIWLVVLMGIVAVGGFIIVAARKRLGEDPGSGSPSFNLAALRDMHARGELSDDEFKKACEHLRQDV
ncbi:MAG: hypothetical protein CMJ39_05565 [Phycisphaerae bacterium]|nr:hypothetical protein [Phycisphaerae bacterium]